MEQNCKHTTGKSILAIMIPALMIFLASASAGVHVGERFENLWSAFTLLYGVMCAFIGYTWKR